MRLRLIGKNIWLSLTLLVALLLGLVASLVFIQKQVINNKFDTTAAEQAHITRTFWYTPHRVAVWVYSPSMRRSIQVQLLLARQWYEDRQLKFSQLYLLDGLRARDDQSGWMLYTTMEQFYKQKNINVVMPIGGESSFYTDWQEPSNGKIYKWETFLTKELPPVLAKNWRSTNERGVLGLSMGGTAAMMLAARQPELFKFAGSLSGFLQTSTMGMPAAIRYATYDAGRYDAYKMFGTPTNSAWKEHDPYLLTNNLRGKGIYLSAGSGTAGPFDKTTELPAISDNYVGAGLEVLSRLSTQNFATKLYKEKIPATVSFEDSGTHIWPYWQREAIKSWSLLAKTLKVKPAPRCVLKPAMLAYAKAKHNTGDCLTNSYPVVGGRAQEFTNGTLYWDKKRNKVIKITGAIAGTYTGLGGSKSMLGLPVSEEAPTPDNQSRYAVFQKGMIYWNDKLGAYAVSGDILKKWAEAGYEKSKAGLPTGPAQKLPGQAGIVQSFQHGLYYWSAKTGAHFVTGKILEKYQQLRYERGFLGMPVSEEITLRNGAIMSKFEHGNLYWLPWKLNTFAVSDGKIMQAWADTGFENGKLGYPISDVYPFANSTRQDFEKGRIILQGNKVTVNAN